MGTSCNALICCEHCAYAGRRGNEEPCKQCSGHSAFVLDISVLNAALAEIKDTLRDLKDLLASNAALEEQAIITRNSLKEINERLRSVELEQARSKGNSKWTDRIIWAITSAALGGAVALALKV